MRALHPRTAVGARRAGVGAAPEASDEALVAHADAGAFEALYRRYGREVYVLAAHLLGSARSEDVVQEIFTRVTGDTAVLLELERPRRARAVGYVGVATRRRVLDRPRARPEHRRPCAQHGDRLGPR